MEKGKRGRTRRSWKNKDDEAMSSKDLEEGQ